MPSVMRLFGALGGLDDDELRATFNGGLGMVVVLPPAAVEAAIAAFDADGIPAAVVGEVVEAATLGGVRYVEGPLEGRSRERSGRVAVGVSGAGSNLRALAAAAGRGELGGEIVLVFADRDCPALDWAAEQGIETALVPGGDDETLAATLDGGRRSTSSSWPATCGSSGRPSWPRSPGGSSTRTRRCCRRSRARTRSRTPSPRACGSPAARSTSSTRRSTAGRSSPRRPCRSCPATTPRRSTTGSGPSSTGCCRGSSRWLLAGAIAVEADGRRVALDLDRADAAVPVPRRALLSVSDKTGLVDARRGPGRARVRARLDRRHGADAARGGPAGHRRGGGDRARPEMLDGRVKTLHPRIHAGLLADRRLGDHRRQLLDAGIAPFELVVVNLYPFAAAARAARGSPSTS